MIIGNNNIGKQNFVSNNRQMQERINDNNTNNVALNPIIS